MLFRIIVVIISITVSFSGASAQKGEVPMNFLPELIQKLGTVLVEVLVLIAEEVEKKN